MKRTRIVSRNFEMVLGIVGSVIGLFSGSMLLFLGALGNIPTPFLGFVAIAASFLGIISSFYVKKNNENKEEDKVESSSDNKSDDAEKETDKSENVASSVEKI